MSQEREVIVISDGKTESRPLTEADVKATETREQRRARFARVLERGFIVDRCTVENLPPNLHGEWVPRDPIEIERKKALGFWIDKEYAPKRALHSDGTTDVAVVGDCIFMVCDREDKELIDEIRRDQYEKMHGSPEKEVRREQVEETGFKSQVSALDVPTPVVDTGKEKSIRKAELEAALK